MNTRYLSFSAIGSLIILMCIITVGYFQIQKTEESKRWIQHTLQVQNHLEELSTNIYELGNAQKGYIITSRPVYLNDFAEVTSKLSKQERELDEFVKDNPVQASNSTLANAKIDELIEYYKTTLELVSKGRTTDAIKQVNSGVGQDLIIKVRALLQEMKNIESNLLNQRLIEEKSIRNRTDITILLGSLISILIVLCFIILAYREYSTREKVQNELNRNSSIQKAILNGAAFALIASDETGKIILFNPAAEKLLGYKPEEVLGKEPGFFHLHDEVDRMAATLSKRFNEEIPAAYPVFTHRAVKGIIETDQWTYVRKDGTHVQVKLTVTPIIDEKGSVSGFVGIAYDISNELAFERALVKAKEEALAGTQAKSEFLANMSHEIRTPMNAIMGMAELLEETPLSEEQQKYVGIFRSAGDSLLNIINDILDLSKIEAGHFELDKSPFTLSTLVEKTAEMMAVKAHQKHLEFAIDIESNLHDFYNGDANRIRQVLINLLGNAIKFTRAGEVVLKVYSGKSTAQNRKVLMMEVSDTGIGMTPDQIKKLFERFSQADSSITKEFGGTGLGLNIAHRLVELMHGKIEVQSTFGHGTKFIISISLEPLTPAPEDELPRISLKGLRFLIVDDTQTNRLIMRKVLEHAGADVEEVDSGVKALKLVEDLAHSGKAPYDMILLDCRMPKLDGFSVAEKIKESQLSPAPMLMMLTSDNRPGDLARSKALGLKAYLVKPVLRNELLKIIDSAMKSSIAPRAAVATSQSSQSLQKGLRILLVDDNDENRLVIRAFLKSQDCRIDDAKNGREALISYQSHPYDLVLMDMQMPIMDGYTATKEIRKLEAENHQHTFVPILALTAYALKEEIDKSIDASCNDHLTKPISKATLLKKIIEHTTPIEVQIDQEMEDLIPDYLKARHVEVVKLLEALEVKDFHLLQTIGHKLRGSAGSYGFAKLSEIGQEIEEKSKVEDSRALTKALADYKLYLRLVKVSYVTV